MPIVAERSSRYFYFIKYYSVMNKKRVRFLNHDPEFSGDISVGKIRFRIVDR
jgi:hypothetical protein